jgi:hypothetical protein
MMDIDIDPNDRLVRLKGEYLSFNERPFTVDIQLLLRHAVFRSRRYNLPVCLLALSDSFVLLSLCQAVQTSGPVWSG